jgi:hypothetical protein
MKTKVKIFASIIFIFILFSGCEKVVEIDLNSAEKKIVIEAIITDKSPVNVKISETTDYFNPETSLMVRNANVTISDSKGNIYVLTEDEMGFYTNTGVIGETGAEYTLSVEFNGQNYKSISYLNPSPVLDTLIIEKSSTGGEEENYHINFYFQNNENKELLTKIDIIQNDVYFGFFVSEWQSRPIFLPFKENDQLLIKLYSLDHSSYDYFKSLWDMTGALSISKVPSNPVNNWDNGALGYFAAMGESEVFLVIR